MKRVITACLVGALMVLVASFAFARGQSEQGTTGGHQTISVILPPWGNLSKDVLKAFETKDNMTVNFSVVGWDQIHDKIAVASAGHTAAADVTEVDWSWVGQFSDANWYTHLNSYVSSQMKSDIPLLPIFTSKGNILAIPYVNDFRIVGYNKKQFDAAGLSTFPSTWNQLVADAKKIKEAGVVQYPIGFPLSASEGTTTNFLLIALSRSGGMFNSNNSLNKANTLSTFQFIDQLVHQDKVVSPNMASMIDQEVAQNFYNGDQTFVFAGPGTESEANNAKKSKIVGQAALGLMPGHSGVRTATFGLPEGVGIPLYDQKKAAAWKFIEFYTSPATQMAIWKQDQTLPTRVSVLQQLEKSGGLQGGEVVVNQAKAIEAVFPAGTPSWYPKFSTTLQNLIFQVATGTTTPQSATDQIAQRVSQLEQ